MWVVVERVIGIIKFIKNIALAVEIIEITRRCQDDSSNSNCREPYDGHVCLDGGESGDSTMIDLRGLERLDEGVSSKHDVVVVLWLEASDFSSECLKYYELTSFVSK